MSRLQEKVDLNLIRYANCWEDADIMLEGVGSLAGKHVLCIASAGDMALSLTGAGAASVHGIDISPVQLYLTELKAIAFRYLEYEELLGFLGVQDSGHRNKYYTALSAHLSEGGKQYWDAHRKKIEKGLIGSGRFENYFTTFRKYFLPLVHSKAIVAALLQEKTDVEQSAFFERKWNTWRWKRLMQFFFSRKVMGKYGRDPEFLKHVDVPVAEYIRNKSEHHLRSAASCRNYLLHMIFTGRFGNGLPHYLRKENFAAIRQNIHRLTLSEMDAGEATGNRTYDVYCFSNIFEYMSDQEFTAVAREWSFRIPSRARIAYWNLMAQRSFSEAEPDHYRLDPVSNDLSGKDNGFFYSRFLVEEKT